MQSRSCLPAEAAMVHLRRYTGWVWGVFKVLMEFNMVCQVAADADILARLRKISQIMTAILALFQIIPLTKASV